jgi:stalled ribosome rescue protein Dom34
MTAHSHAIVWLDHTKAKVLFFNADDDSVAIVRAASPRSHIHTKAGSASGEHLHGDTAYFAEITATLAPVRTFLVVGPSTAREEFADYLREHRPELAARLAGSERLDKESDGQLLAYARLYFRRHDRMTPQH